ncbi:hypothetical protein QR680_012227 [Steinernema hermaphroditum]|uniref:Uncharacterized protein n=1 Tax=Steinernema hermaphroditum TaxID=289476 RepID=A0AA39I1C3_9BILA|nr:hypothetical protein QR680_012227 [Steinernema hermaphroditum]
MSAALLGISVLLCIAFLLVFDFPDELKPPKSWFRVLWGYPTFINYIYEDVYTHAATNYDDISHLLPKTEPSTELLIANDHPQRCDFALSSPGRCFYKVTPERCSPNGRLPLLWEDTVVECYDPAESEVDCLSSEMRVDNETCRNVPDKVIYKSQKTLIYFTNVDLNAWHVEKSEFLLERENCSFVPREQLIGDRFFGLWRPDDGRRCSGARFAPINYGIDMSSTCLNQTRPPANEEECNELSEASLDFLLSQVNVSRLCKCDRCDISVSVERPKNRTYWLADNETETCSAPSRMVVTVFTNDSNIQEIHTRFYLRNITCAQNAPCLMSLESQVEFKEAQEKIEIARFWLKRGRFHCPSEVTCWKEMFYFFELIDFYAPFAEYLTVVPIFFVSALYLFKRHYTQTLWNLLGVK